MNKASKILIPCLGIAVILFVSCSIAGGAIYLLSKGGDEIERYTNIFDDHPITDIQDNEPINLDNRSSGRPNGPVLKIYRPELELFIETLDLMDQGKVLPGSRTGDQITYDDYKKSELSSIVRKKSDYEKKKQSIDTNMLPLFDSSEGMKAIEQIAFQARAEYIDYLKKENVNPKVVEELETVVFPADRKHLWVSRSIDLYKESSFVREMRSDKFDNLFYSEAEMRFETGTAYSVAYRVYLSGLFGKEPSDKQEKIQYWKDIREFAVRRVFYHEMTHVLQIAYQNLYVKKYGEEYKRLPYSQKTTLKLCNSDIIMDTNLTPFTERDNLFLCKEAQAELVADYFIFKKFALDDTQQNTYWNYLGAGERMVDVRSLLDQIIPSITVTDPAQNDRTKYEEMNNRLKHMFKEEADHNLKDQLVDIASNTSVSNLVYDLGYRVDYSENEAKKFLSSL